VLFAFRVVRNDTLLALGEEQRPPTGNPERVAVVADAGRSDRALDELGVDARLACFDRIAAREAT
jgi:hypothetical protein